MQDLNSPAAQAALMEAVQCTAAARAVAAQVMYEIPCPGAPEHAARSERACELAMAVEICLKAAIAAHERIGL